MVKPPSVSKDNPDFILQYDNTTSFSDRLAQLERLLERDERIRKIKSERYTRDMREAENKGFEKGRTQGDAEGYDKGYRYGHIIGVEEGKKQEMENTERKTKLAYDEGFTAGQKSGQKSDIKKLGSGRSPILFKMYFAKSKKHLVFSF